MDRSVASFCLAPDVQAVLQAHLYLADYQDLPVVVAAGVKVVLVAAAVAVAACADLVYS